MLIEWSDCTRKIKPHHRAILMQYNLGNKPNMMLTTNHFDRIWVILIRWIMLEEALGGASQRTQKSLDRVGSVIAAS
jgi:hypothetical protein